MFKLFEVLIFFLQTKDKNNTEVLDQQSIC
jgi:hypothetical protein